jgi:NNP family nitrate/nitrite transporter-like MFS transporter
MAKKNGTVTFVSDSLIKVDNVEYPLIKMKKDNEANSDKFSILPTSKMWQEPVVKVGDQVKKKQLLAKGTTHISFQANMWIALIFIFIIGFWWGIGKAAVYKHIAEYYPKNVGAVGGMVGLIGGLGGFFTPIILGYLLDWTGMWTSMWIYLFIISVACLWWMHRVITKMRDEAAPETKQKIEKPINQ